MARPKREIHEEKIEDLLSSPESVSVANTPHKPPTPPSFQGDITEEIVVENNEIEEIAEYESTPHYDDVAPVEPVVETIEEEPVEENGWTPLIDACHNGMPYYVSDKPRGDGVLAYWKKTRAFANATHRWEEYGKFVNHITGMDLPFIPKYFRYRY